MQAKALAEGEIAAAYDSSSGWVVFYRGAGGELNVVSSALDGTWKAPLALDIAKPTAHASLFAVKIGSSVHGFYSHDDKSIHKLVLEGGQWKGNPPVFPNSDVLC